MRILSVSDKVDQVLYGPALKRLFGDVDLVLSCGDLPYYYLEYIMTVLGGPLFYVMGNHPLELRQHAQPLEKTLQLGNHPGWQSPMGCQDIDGRGVRYRRLLIAGLEGSMRYNQNPSYQYTERQMFWKVWNLVPSFLLNRLRYGRYVDIVISHAPPQGIHDLPDLCHQGFRVFRTLMELFRPRYWIHGHVHVYNPAQPVETRYRSTQVINTYGHKSLEIEEGSLR